MKKKNIFWSILGLLLILVSCNQDLEEAIPASPVQPQGSVATNHFYGTAPTDQPVTKGVAQLDKVWRAGTTIKVKLLNDPYNMAEEIKNAAAEWEDYANIKFRFVEANEDAHVRIGFDWNENRWITWSYTGTDCKIVTKQNEATMSFAFFDILTAEERHGDVLRAFGQVLGLELEHRHLSFDAGWTKYISQYWEGEIEDIPWEELKKYVLDPLETENVMQTDTYDENSIMIWPFNRKYANNTARDFNNQLSDKDKEFIDKLYPGKEKAIITLQIENFIRFEPEIARTGDLIIDWGDGDKITYKPTDNILHDFSNSESRKIKFYGDATTITQININKGSYSNNGRIHTIDLSECINLQSLDLSSLETTSLDISKCTKLERLSCSEIGLTSLDVSNCTKLKSLYCTGNKLTSLDVSKCVELEDLYCYSNNLSSLDVSKCVKLFRLECSYNSNLTSINASGCTDLRSLICYHSNLTTLNVAKCVNLFELSCSNNNLTDIDISECINLNDLFIYNNNLTSLDVSKCIKLRKLYLSSNNVSELDISKCTELEQLSCGSNSLSELDISKCTKLTSLSCDSNNLSNLNLASSKVYSLNLTNNPLYNNELEMKNIANQLADRRSTWSGYFYVERDNKQEVSNWIEDILTAKNWNFREKE